MEYCLCRLPSPAWRQKHKNNGKLYPSTQPQQVCQLLQGLQGLLMFQNLMWGDPRPPGDRLVVIQSKTEHWQMPKFVPIKEQ